jgi:hypothetical protein
MKKIKLCLVALVALLSSVAFNAKAITAGDIVSVNGILFKVPTAANLIPNGSFNDGFTNWKEANNTDMTSTNFTVFNTGGGVDDNTYLVGKANAGATAAGSIGTAWPIQKGKAYFMKYYVKYVDTTKVDGSEQYLKISTGDTYGTETTVLMNASKAGGKNKWAVNEVTFIAKNTLLQAKFRWLSGLYAFDSFYLCQMDSVGLDLTLLTNAITDAENYAKLNYPGLAALNTAINAAKAAKNTIKSADDITAEINKLNAAVRTYRLTQTVAAGDTLDFSFAIINPGVDASSNTTLPNGWNITYTNGNGYSGTGQHYSGVTTNRYLDSWNGTAGALIYYAEQKVAGIPNGVYIMKAAARSSGSKAYVFANDKQTEIINNVDQGGSLGKGWNLMKVDTVLVLDHAIRIGAKTVTGWTGTWFSADDFTIKYIGSKPALLNSVAYLDSLKASKGKLYPAFDMYTKEYTLVLPAGTASFDLTGFVTAPGSTIQNAGTITVKNGSGQVTVVVTSKDGSTKTSYVINYTLETAQLKHSFTFADGTAKDVVGKASGTVVGTTSVISNGVFVSNSDYITLPGDSINLSKYGAITLEAYITSSNKLNTNYSMLAYFGGASGANSFWIQPTRSTTGGSRVSASTNYAEAKRLDDGLSYHIVAMLTQDSIYYYLNGALAAKYAAPNQISRIVNTNAYLAKGGWSDPIWKGTLHEFNIYNGVMDAATIALRSKGLPEDNFLTSLKAENINLIPAFNKDTLNYSIMVPKGTRKVNLSAIPSFAGATVTGAGDITISGNTTVANIVVKPSDKTLPSRTYKVTINVIPSLVLLNHSYTFEDGTAKDVVNGADGVVSGKNAKFVNGAYVSNGDYITLPGNTIGLNNYAAITLEGYITAENAQNPNYTMLSYFGGLSGSNCIWIQPTRGGSETKSQNEASGVAVNGIEMDEGLTHHVVSVLTLDTLFYYIDGELAAKKATGGDKISNILRTNAWLCKGGWSDPVWKGTIHEFNIYNGELSAADIKAHANAFLANKGIALRSLSVDYYNMYPNPFSTYTKNYGVVVPAGTGKINLTAVPFNAGVTIKGAGIVDVSEPNGIDTLWITSKDQTVRGYYLVSYTHTTPLKLNHSWTFEDGTAKDVVGKADGTLVGGKIANGAYVAEANGQYINLPANVIKINTYPSITAEMFIKAANNGNGTNVMAAYFGNTVGSYGNDYFFISHKSRAAITCGMPASPWSVETGVSGSKELDDAGYYHMVSTLTNDTIGWYIDGVLVGKAALSPANKIFNLSNNLAYLCKSGYTGDATWVGSILEFNLYSGVMSDALIASRAKAYLATGIDKAENAGEISVLTRNGAFELNTPSANGSVKVYNMSGKCVYSGMITSAKQLLPVAQSGVYFIEVMNGAQRTTLKAAMK